jgi:hypothetical protein
LKNSAVNSRLEVSLARITQTGWIGIDRVDNHVGITIGVDVASGGDGTSKVVEIGASGPSIKLGTICPRINRSSTDLD